MSACSEKITTLLLDSSFLPYSFLTGKATFLHLLKNSIKSFDANENLIDNNLSWFSNDGICFYEDQPFLTSKDKIWLLPTIAVLKRKTFFMRKRIPKTLNLSKLCVIFDYTCQICYEKLPKDQFTIEHIFPKSKGGTRDIENISLSCNSCNQKKKDIYPFYDVKNTNIKGVPLPLPILPNKYTEIRPEWNKFFIYKKT
jgi:5-methylcytosine-specific restriction endonuclease McrA